MLSNPIYPKEWRETYKITVSSEETARNIFNFLKRNTSIDPYILIETWPQEGKPPTYGVYVERQEKAKAKKALKGTGYQRYLTNPVYPKEWSKDEFKIGDRVRVRQEVLPFLRRPPEKYRGVVKRSLYAQQTQEMVYQILTEDDQLVWWAHSQLELDTKENPVYPKEWPDYGNVVRTGYDESDLIPVERVLDKYEIRHWRMTGVKSDLDNTPLITLHVQENDYLLAKRLIDRAL